ncbi:MAG: four helix bundle protein [Bacteroidota bacterium]|nr:four helix bundle protein [Bacteroidota bacterium]
MTIKKFEDLEIWQIARTLSQQIFKFTRHDNFSKDFALKDQIKRSAGSTMDNIAEGFGRGGNREFIQFLAIANGSACEVKSQLYRALDNNYIKKEEFESAYEEANKLSNKIGSFIQYLNKTPIRGEKFRTNA